MPTDPRRVEIAGAVRDRFARDQSLTVLQARAFVRSIQTTWQVGVIQWRADESDDFLSQAERLVDAARILSEAGEEHANDALMAFRRAGEHYEWLARAGDGLGKTIPLGLMAAGCFQLGGLPAMASGLLRQLNPADEGIQLFASFLMADFDGTLQKVAAFWVRHPELRVRDAARTFFTSRDGESDTAWVATVEIVRCTGLAANSLRRGDHSRLEKSIEQLKRLEELLLRLASSDVSLLAFFVRAVCEKYRNSTIYKPLMRLADQNPGRRNYMSAFARRQYARGRGILWQSQEEGIGRLLSGSSFALCTPTGSGKTLVANLAIVKELLLNIGDGLVVPLALYLVPSRALAGEVEAKLTHELGHEFIVTGLYGGADWGITDAWLTTDRPTVLIATVEKADALMRYLGPILPARTALLIVDEAHQVVIEDSVHSRESFAEHSNRAIRLESFISRLLSRRSDIVRIALTAVAGGAAGPVARWIESDDNAEAVGTYYRSTRQAVGKLEIRPNAIPVIEINQLNDRPLTVQGRQEFYIRLQIPQMPEAPAAVRNGLNHHTQNAVLWTALHLADSSRRILISVMQSPEDTMRWYAEAFDLSGWENAPRFVPPTDAADVALLAEARTVCVDYCGAQSHEVKLLDRGIATNHGQMPQRLRRMMVALVDRSICRITVATATLTEGVNLPFDIIFLASLKRTTFDSVRSRQVEHPIPTSEFRNLSGRAGRPGAAKGMEGMTLVALPMVPSTTAAGSRPTQLRQARARRDDYADLLQRLDADATGAGQHFSPLAILLKAIRSTARNLPGIRSDAGFLEWLARTAPGDVSPRAGTSDTAPSSRLADSLDELDGIIVSAIEEVQQVEVDAMTSARAEAVLVAVWQKTFARVASSYEAWMEEAFIKRGKGVVETIYPDANERKRLYSYGYSPYIGRRFEQAADRLVELLEGAESYGTEDEDQRLERFVELGQVVAADGGYGYLVRDTVTARDLYARWPDVLAWWMQHPEADSPSADELRSWQTFVSDNLEFRLGVAIGAAVARVWSDNTENVFDTPTLATWKDTSGLPWFAFWAKELLRWGTLEPFVAFALSQGLGRSRSDAEALRAEFIEWLSEDREDEPSGEELIDPQNFLQWSRSRVAPGEPTTAVRAIAATLTGSDGSKELYAVLPLRSDGKLAWIDASGYDIATSQETAAFFGPNIYQSDFDLTVRVSGAEISRVF